MAQAASPIQRAAPCAEQRRDRRDQPHQRQAQHGARPAAAARGGAAHRRCARPCARCRRRRDRAGCERASALWPSQIAPAALDRRRQRHVVDQRAAHRLDAADAVERAAADQDGAARRRRGRAGGSLTAGERVEELEEEHEGRHQRPLGRGSRSSAPPSRRRGRARPAPPCATSVARWRGVVHDVGIGQQHELARPPPRRPAPPPRACRSSPPGAAAPSMTVRRASPIARAIAPVPSVLPSSTRTTRNAPGIILRQQRAQAGCDRVGASSRAGTTTATAGAGGRAARARAPGPPARTGHGRAADRPRPAATEPASADHAAHARLLARNQATASTTASRAGRGA